MRTQKTTMRDRHDGQYFGSQRSEYQMQVCVDYGPDRYEVVRTGANKTCR